MNCLNAIITICDTLRQSTTCKMIAAMCFIFWRCKTTVQGSHLCEHCVSLRRIQYCVCVWSHFWDPLVTHTHTLRPWDCSIKDASFDGGILGLHCCWYPSTETLIMTGKSISIRVDILLRVFIVYVCKLWLSGNSTYTQFWIFLLLHTWNILFRKGSGFSAFSY